MRTFIKIVKLKIGVCEYFFKLNKNYRWKKSLFGQRRREREAGLLYANGPTHSTRGEFVMNYRRIILIKRPPGMPKYLKR